MKKNSLLSDQKVSLETSKVELQNSYDKLNQNFEEVQKSNENLKEENKVLKSFYNFYCICGILNDFLLHRVLVRVKFQLTEKIIS